MAFQKNPPPTSPALRAPPKHFEYPLGPLSDRSDPSPREEEKRADGKSRRIVRAGVLVMASRPATVRLTGGTHEAFTAPVRVNCFLRAMKKYNGIVPPVASAWDSNSFWDFVDRQSEPGLAGRGCPRHATLLAELSNRSRRLM